MTDGEIGQFDPVSGRAHDIGVTLTGLSFRLKRGERRYPYADFGSDLIDALHKGLPVPRRRGLLRSTLVCPSCGSPLEAAAIGPVPVTTELVLKKIPPIRIELEMAGWRCPACDRALVKFDRDVASDLSFALMDAFATVGLSPG